MSKNSFRRMSNDIRALSRVNIEHAINYADTFRKVDPFAFSPRKFQRPVLVGGKGGKLACQRGRDSRTGKPR